MNQWLKVLGANSVAPTNILKLKQVITGEEPDIATFEVPISYNLLQELRNNNPKLDIPYRLSLFVDDSYVSTVWTNNAINGNCLLVWNTIYNPPGPHQLQAELLLGGASGTRVLRARGPIMPFYSSNVMQFDSFYSGFTGNKAILYARVPKTNVSYSIELRTFSGKHIKTITGSTTNGVIEEHWNLTDERGNKFTDDSAEAVFHVTLLDGGTNTVTETHVQKTGLFRN